MAVPALSPLVELVRASRARATGAFALSAPAGGGLTVDLQGGAVVEVGGAPGLLSGVGVSGSGSLQQDLGAAVGAGAATAGRATFTGATRLMSPR